MDVLNTCSTLAQPTPSIHLFTIARTRCLTTKSNFFLSLAPSTLQKFNPDPQRAIILALQNAMFIR